jgi:hypothetical protein
MRVLGLIQSAMLTYIAVRTASTASLIVLDTVELDIHKVFDNVTSEEGMVLLL